MLGRWLLLLVAAAAAAPPAIYEVKTRGGSDDDRVPSAGDLIIITFDNFMNPLLGPERGVTLDTAAVDGLFTFSPWPPMASTILS